MRWVALCQSTGAAGSSALAWHSRGVSRCGNPTDIARLCAWGLFSATQAHSPWGFLHPCDPPTAVWVGREGCHQACSLPRIVLAGLCAWVALNSTHAHILAMSVGFLQRETPRPCHAKALEPAAPVLWHSATLLANCRDTVPTICRDYIPIICWRLAHFSFSFLKPYP